MFRMAWGEGSGISMKQHEILAQKSLAIGYCYPEYWPIECLLSYLCQAPPLVPLVLDNEQVFLKNVFHYMG